MNIELLYIQTENILNSMKCPFKQPPPPPQKRKENFKMQINVQP